MDVKYMIALGGGLLLNLGLTKWLIPHLHKLKFGQTVRKEGPQSHLNKTGTPTMGGIGFIITPLVVMLLLMPQSFTDVKFLIAVLAFVGYGLIGFLDDFIIVVKKDNEGLKPKYKLLLQSVLAIVFFLMYRSLAPSTILIPFVNVTLDLGWLYGILVFLMFTAETNAVNFADGLDGLCAGLVVMALAPFVLFSVIEGEQELAVFLLALMGALFGYLRYNLHPAKIMMGDTGSLALGGVLAASAMILKQEIALVVIGGVFVAEMVSVVLQVSYFKLTHGKRIFKMAPLHHHFELSGYKETQVVMMFWFAGLLLAIIGILMGVMM